MNDTTTVSVIFNLTDRVLTAELFRQSHVLSGYLLKEKNMKKVERNMLIAFLEQLIKQLKDNNIKEMEGSIEVIYDTIVSRGKGKKHAEFTLTGKTKSR